MIAEHHINKVMKIEDVEKALDYLSEIDGTVDELFFLRDSFKYFIANSKETDIPKLQFFREFKNNPDAKVFTAKGTAVNTVEELLETIENAGII